MRKVHSGFGLRRLLLLVFRILVVAFSPSGPSIFLVSLGVLWTMPRRSVFPSFCPPRLFAALIVFGGSFTLISVWTKKAGVHFSLTQLNLLEGLSLGGSETIFFCDVSRKGRSEERKEVLPDG